MRKVVSRITSNLHQVSDSLLPLHIQPEPKTNTPLSNITVLLVTESSGRSGRQICLAHTVQSEPTCPSLTHRLFLILSPLSQSCYYRHDLLSNSRRFRYRTRKEVSVSEVRIFQSTVPLWFKAAAAAAVAWVLCRYSNFLLQPKGSSLYVSVQ